MFYKQKKILEISMSKADAINILSENLDTPRIFPTIFSTNKKKFQGLIKEDSTFEIQQSIYFFHNILKPYLIGKFKEEGERTIIELTFNTEPFYKVSIFLILILLILDFLDRKNPYALESILFLIGFFLLLLFFSKKIFNYNCNKSMKFLKEILNAKEIQH